MNKIILLTDDPYQRNLFTSYLSKKSYEVEPLDSLNAWNTFSPVEEYIIISQCSWLHMQAPELVHFIRQKSNAPIIIFTTDTDNLKQAISTIKAGAFDYLLLPVRPDELLSAVKLAFNLCNQRVPTNKLSTSNNLYVGANQAFQQALEQVKLVAETPYSVIIYGESGTGKEMIAKLIHEQSDRRSKPFVAIDCGALTEELANSELFGHEKGAFTGALQFKRGCLEEAAGGTVFLDEIPNLSYSIQVALLRVLQERKIKRIGSTNYTSIDVRIIVASNEQLKDKIQSGLFREDLFYRLNEFYIELPTLRERREEIPDMVSHFINESNKELEKNITGCSEAVLNILLKYDFPGNLRELKNIIRSACLVATETITIADLPNNLLNSIQYVPAKQETVASFAEQERYKEGLGLVTTNRSPNALKDMLQLREFELILNTLQEHKFNKSKVARLLKIDRKTLYNKLAFFKSKNFTVC